MKKSSVAKLDNIGLPMDEIISDEKLRFKATLLYGIGEFSSSLGSGKGIQFCSKFLTGLTEISMQIIMLLATDLEKFSKHAKRTTVSVDDVKLYSRRNCALLAQLSMEIISIKQLKQYYKRF